MAVCRWTDQETDDNVMGSGCETWEWYETCIRLDPDRPGTYVVRMATPDSGGTPSDGTATYRFTRGKVRSTVTDMAMGRLPVNDTIRGYARRDDMDADSMDCVIQWIVYGEIVFG
jgi:hypothetical protein